MPAGVRPAGATSFRTEDGVPLKAMVDGDGRLDGRSEELVGKIIEGRYKIERVIGKGGMGTSSTPAGTSAGRQGLRRR